VSASHGARATHAAAASGGLGIGARPAAPLAVAACAALLLAAPGAAEVYLTQPQALAQAFPGARIERRAFTLTEAEARAVESRARARLSTRLVVAYAAWSADTLAGTAFFDSRRVRTMPGVFMIVVSPDSAVERVEVLAFHEPPDYRPPERWLDRLAGGRLDERLWPGRDIRNLSGATLSVRAITESVRLAIALYQVVVAPSLVAGAAGGGGR
jgi:hypothetical protein